MKYTKPQEVDYGDYDPEGNSVNGFVTEALGPTGLFNEAVHKLVLKETNRTYGRTPVLMTVRAHWSGYSEFTVTNQWSEVILTAPDWNWEREWPSLGDFLRDLAEANPEADQ